ncbi:methylated-DNA--[protein]-cysteine S-methyltransferase [Chitinibacter tainanensis]|uniref:methylated-DNA--[protein]-cysteine S-methyltransferase n=1 Tax=Chitinibacter tainanensis TaxID=230667 RepID=UPI001B7FDBE4|nr:methylated-DNA--[protein]-cysteine S-methyltransferase [Chitinibacter tainanensis]
MNLNNTSSSGQYGMGYLAEASDFAQLVTPFGGLALWANAQALLRVEFLLEAPPAVVPTGPILQEAVRQLEAYWRDPHFTFTLPLLSVGTAHQQQVWAAMQRIPVGQTRSYGELARELQSSALAVGTACGRNPYPVIIPCHRILGAKGLGGFNAQRDGRDWLPIKRWLLAHEGVH